MEFYRVKNSIKVTLAPNMGPTRPICSILKFIGEQEQLKKLSDNFGLSKQNKLHLTLTEKVQRSKKIICEV